MSLNAHAHPFESMFLQSMTATLWRIFDSLTGKLSYSRQARAVFKSKTNQIQNRHVTRKNNLVYILFYSKFLFKLCTELKFVNNFIFMHFFMDSHLTLLKSLFHCFVVFSEAGATFTHYVKSKTKLDLYLIKRSKFHTKGLELKTKKKCFNWIIVKNKMHI